MHTMTEQNLINAFGGESQAHMRYLIFGDIARHEGFANVARLFQAVAHAEYVHAGDHYTELKHLDGGFVANSMAAFGPGNTAKNLALAIAGETFEIEEMYPAYRHVAQLQEERGAVRSFEWAYGTEIMHKALFEKAQAAVNAGKDVALGAVQICAVCGYTVEGSAPDRCPLCKATRDKFVAFDPPATSNPHE
ncbi:MAG: rubrerythrin family protein [Kiritimatiellae bacterium]|nr:rubrerythrin family protein [Kiritimatiellia bacterium]